MDLDQLHNLPVQTTSFLGREAELAELARLLADPGVRLLTIWGPGGIGKTRLAIEAAARNASQYADGVVFVPLQPVDTAGGVPTAIAEALGIPLTGSVEPLDQVLASLRDKQLLLLLDNTEQLGGEVALFSGLLAAAPGLTLLVTSREALKLQEEWLFPLGGLEWQAHDAQGDSVALRLLIERARQVRPAALSEAERAAAIEICRLVEGMPLAIELAATWMRTLSCEAIAAEIRRNIDLLASSLRNISERHRSLRAVCDQSWALLEEQERRAFARLAVFRAGFSAEAAAAVAGASLLVLDALVSKSLVRRVAPDRYQIHELLRQYAEERLHQAPDEAMQTAAALGQFYVAFLNHWFMLSASQGVSAAALVAIAAEIENIRAAWGAILDQCDAMSLQHVTNMVQIFYYVRGSYHEGVALIEQALDRQRHLAKTPALRLAIADCLNSLGWFRLRQGRILESRQLFYESVALYRDLDLPLPPGDATDPLAGLGLVAAVEGDYREAVRLAVVVVQRAEAEQHRNNQVTGLYVLVSATLAQGQYQIAQRYAQLMYSLVEEQGNRWFLAYCLIELGNIAIGLGSYATARRYYEQAYVLREEFADPEGMAVALAAQGKAALFEGQPGEARQFYERSLAIYRYLGDQGGLATALDGLGRAHLALGAYAPARAALEQALRIATEMAYLPRQIAVLISAAELLLAVGAQAQARALLGPVARHPAADRETNQRVHTLLLSSEAITPLHLGVDAAPDLAAVAEAARRDLLALDLPDASPPGAAVPDGLVEPLSAREREILSHIAAGRSNQEIADLLIFSVGTIKWYTTQIYGKLGVRSRTQAVARARELGLLNEA